MNVANTATTLKAPFPWFGGKRKVAHIVWQRFGDCLNYVEPFAGSLAVLLGRPFAPRIETVNDKDCYLANFWRATQHDPAAVAHYADWPVNEADLHARHLWLINQVDFRERIMVDSDYYDAKIAGWWVWGISAWIGSGWCSVEYSQNSGLKTDGSVRRKQPAAIGKMRGQGVHSLAISGTARPNLRPHQGVQSVPRQARRLSGSQGVARQMPFVGGSGAHGQGVHQKVLDLQGYMLALSERLRKTRVVCGDWTRIMGPSVTYKIGLTGILLDPPYNAEAGRQDGLYAQDDLQVSTAVRQWCLEHITDGDRSGRVAYEGPRYRHPKLRIALCGYEGEGHGILEGLGWEVVAWKSNGGYGGQRKSGKNDNAGKERIWFSPHCIKPMEALPLLAMLEA